MPAALPAMRGFPFIVFILSILAGLVLAPSLFAQSAAPSNAPPPNAQARLTGPGWECVHGYRRQGEVCIALAVPVHAMLTPDGRGWRCEHGFLREGETCTRLVVPANAVMSSTGRSWRCVEGWQRQGTACVSPRRGAEPVTGRIDRADDCPRGFRTQADGRCVRFTLPDRASYDATGHDWICLVGYIRDGDTCRPLSAEERNLQATRLAWLASDGLALIAEECRPVLREALYGGIVCTGPRTSLLENRCVVTRDAQSGEARLLCAGADLKPLTASCSISLAGKGALSCGNGPADNQPADHASTDLAFEQ